MDENKIIPYIEPIFRFCYKRLSNRYDAENLASEIICHILEGMNKYQIESLDAWVWRIAHNRYARFIDNRNKIKSYCHAKMNFLTLLIIPMSMRTTHRSNMKRCFAICTRYLPSTKIFLWTTILANCHSEVLPKSILSPKPQSNGD